MELIIKDKQKSKQVEAPQYLCPLYPAREYGKEGKTQNGKQVKKKNNILRPLPYGPLPKKEEIGQDRSMMDRTKMVVGKPTVGPPIMKMKKKEIAIPVAPAPPKKTEPLKALKKQEVKEEKLKPVKMKVMRGGEKECPKPQIKVTAPPKPKPKAQTSGLQVKELQTPVHGNGSNRRQEMRVVNTDSKTGENGSEKKRTETQIKLDVIRKLPEWNENRPWNNRMIARSLDMEELTRLRAMMDIEAEEKMYGGEEDQDYGEDIDYEQ